MRQSNPDERRLYLPDGRYYKVPSWATEEDIAAFRARNPEILDDPTRLGAVVEGLKNIPKGVAGTAASIGSGITALLPGDTGAQDKIGAFQERLRQSSDPRYLDSYIAQLGQGLGSGASFLGIGALGGLPTVAAAGALSGAGEQAERMAIAEEEGDEVTAIDRVLATVLGTAVGATEAFPIKRLLGPVASSAGEAAIRRALTGQGSRLGDALQSAVIQGLEEGVQEFGAGTAQNVISKYTYDPETKVMADIRDFTVGAGTGAILDVLTRAASGGYNGLAATANWQRERANRKATLGLSEQDQQEIAYEVETQLEETGEYLPQIRTYAPVRNPDGTYQVVDERGTPIAQALMDEQGATQAIEALEKKDLVRAAYAGSYLQLRNQGLENDSNAMAMAMLVRDPHTTHTPVYVLANYMRPDEYGANDLGVSRRSVDRAKAEPRLRPFLQAGRSMVSMAEAHQTLSPEEWKKFIRDRAAIGAAEYAALNRNYMATINPQTGRPKVKSFRRNDLISRSITRAARKTRDVLSGVTAAGEEINFDGEIKKSDIENMLRDKGYSLPKRGLSSPEGKALVRAITGVDKLNDPDVKMLLATQLAHLPVRTGAPVPMPDLSPIRYNPQDPKRALDFLENAGERVSENDLKDALNLQKAQFDQLMDHLSRGNMIHRTGPNSSPYYNFVPTDERIATKASEEIEALTQKAAGQIKPPAFVEESLRQIRDARAAERNVPPEVIDQEEGSPKEKAEYIQGVQETFEETIPKVKDMLEDHLLNVGVRTEKGATVEVVKGIERSLEDILKQTTHYVAGSKPAAAFVDPGNAPAKIWVDVSQILAENPEATADQIFEELLPVVNYELVRYFRNYDYFTQNQWESLRRVARRTEIPEGLEGAGQTWYDWAASRLAEETQPLPGPYEEGVIKRPFDPEARGSQEAIAETAIARMFREFADDHWMPKRVGRDTRPLFKKAVGWYKDLIGLGMDQDLSTALSVFSQMRAGNFKSMEPGLSVLNPEGPVRSLLTQDREIRPRGRAVTLFRGSPTGEQGNFYSPNRSVAESYAGESGTVSEETFRVINPLDAQNWMEAKETLGLPRSASMQDLIDAAHSAGHDWVTFNTKNGLEYVRTRPLHIKDQARNSEGKDAEVLGKAVEEQERNPTGVPRVGSFASPEALNVYYERGVDQQGEEIPTVRFSYKIRNLSPPRYRPEGMNAPTDYNPDDRTKIERIQQAFDQDGFMSNIRGWWDDTWKHFRQRYIDNREGIERLDERARKKRIEEGEAWQDLLADQSSIAAMRFRDASMHFIHGIVSRGSIRYVGDSVMRGHYQTKEWRDSQGNVYYGLKDLFGLLENPQTGESDELNAYDYLIAHRVLRMKQEGDTSPTPGGMTADQAQEIIDRIDTEPDAAHIRQFADGYRAFNDTLIDFMVDTGMLSEEMAQSWRGRMYVPFYRFMDKDSVQMAKRMAAYKKAQQKKKGAFRATKRTKIEEEMKGTEDPIDIDLITGIMSNVEAVVSDGMRNVAYNRIVRDLQLLNDGGYVEAPSQDASVLRVVENGEVKYYKTDDAFLVQSALTGNEVLLEGIAKFLGATPAHILRESVTRNPAFMLRNLLRDTLSVAVTSGANYTPLKDTMQNFFSSESFEMAEKLGVALGHDFVNNPDIYRKQMLKILTHEHAEGAKGQVMRIWDALGNYSRRSDSATRMAVYQDVMDRTGNEAEAIYQALEIINFGRRGNDPLWRTITASVPFLNARIQGLDVLGRTFAGRYTANADLRNQEGALGMNRIQLTAFTRGLMLAGMTGMYYALVSDKEWYKEQRDEVKDDYWMIPVGDGTLLSVPVPFEVGLLFKTIPEQFLRNMFEEGYTNKRHAESVRRSVFQATNFQAIPQVFKPLLDTLTNRNSFTGEPIVPYYMEEGLPEEEHRTPDTNEAAVVLGELADISPMKIEYLINGYFGPMAMYALMVGDKIARIQGARAALNVVPWYDETPPLAQGSAGTRQDFFSMRSAPVLRQVFREVGAGGGHQQQFYALRQQVDRAVAKVNRLKNQRRFDDMRVARHENAALLNMRGTVNRLDRYMARWRQRRDQILMSSDYTPDDKRERLKRLEEERDRQLAVVPILMQAVEESR